MNGCQRRTQKRAREKWIGDITSTHKSLSRSCRGGSGRTLVGKATFSRLRNSLAELYQAEPFELLKPSDDISSRHPKSRFHQLLSRSSVTALIGQCLGRCARTDYPAMAGTESIRSWKNGHYTLKPFAYAWLIRTIKILMGSEFRTWL